MQGGGGPIVTGDLGFNDTEGDKKEEQEEQEQQQEEEEAAALSSITAAGTPQSRSSDIPEDPLFADFREYRKCSLFSVADMRELNVAPLQPVR